MVGLHTTAAMLLRKVHVTLIKSEHQNLNSLMQNKQLRKIVDQVFVEMTGKDEERELFFGLLCSLYNEERMSPIVKLLMKHNVQLDARSVEFRNAWRLLDKWLIAKAWTKWYACFQVSRRAYQQLGNEIYKHAYMTVRRIQTLMGTESDAKTLAKIMEREKEIRKNKGACFIAKMELVWQNEWVHEIVRPSEEMERRVYTRSWLEEDHYTLKKRKFDENDEEVQRQWQMAQKRFRLRDPDNLNRFFSPSPRFIALDRKIKEAFWRQVDLEIHYPFTPNFGKVWDAAELVFQRMRKPSRKLEEVMEHIYKKIANGMFEYERDGVDTLCKTFEEELMMHPVLSMDQNFQRCMNMEAHKTLDKKLRNLYKMAGDVLLYDANYRVGCYHGIQIEATRAPECLERTRMWLVHRHGGNLAHAVVVGLVQNAPALTLIFPETFAKDMRYFRAFYNLMQTTVDLRIGMDVVLSNVKEEARPQYMTWLATNSFQNKETEVLLEIKKRCRLTAVGRHELLQKLIVYMQACVERELYYDGEEAKEEKQHNMHEPFGRDAFAEEALSMRFHLFMSRLCRVVHVNYQMYGHVYDNMIWH